MLLKWRTLWTSTLDAVREIVVAQNAITSSIAAMNAARVLVEASRTAYDAAVASYEHGVGTITETIVTQTQLLQAKLAFDNTYSSALSSAATWAFPTGALGGAPEK